MKESILLFHAPEKKELLKIQKALLPLHIRVRTISREQYCQSLGFLAGMKDFSPTTETYEGDDLPAPFFVFCFLAEQRLDQVLFALRKCGSGPYPYKAILTPSNCEWDILTCFEEIRKEHEKMHGENQ